MKNNNNKMRSLKSFKNDELNIISGGQLPISHPRVWTTAGDQTAPMPYSCDMFYDSNGNRHWDIGETMELFF